LSGFMPEVCSRPERLSSPQPMRQDQTGPGPAERGANFCGRTRSCRLITGGTPPQPRGQMRTITTTEELASFCAAAKSGPYVTIDTEFLRERTYWSKLCLIQMALPGKDGDAVLVDPIVGDEMSMEPLYDLFRHEATVKVFHAARQDLEIFFVEGGVFPVPLFDTQIAAMVCGFG